MVSEKTDIAPDTFLVGIAASPGIAIGETFLLNRTRMTVVERAISPEEVSGEIEAFMEAVARSKQQLEEVKAGVSDRDLAEHLYIIDTHLLILEDQMLLGETISAIRNDRVNAEGALRRVLHMFRQVFDGIEDEYLRERRSDIDSIGDRLLRNLMGHTQQSLSEIDRKAVIIAHDLSPADTMQMDRDRVVGFITDVGGRTSHTAILGRSLGIPAVVGMETATSVIPGGVPVILDGSHGTVILNPTPETFHEYLKKKQSLEYHERELLAYRDLPSVTLDGATISLRGNVEMPEEIPMVLEQGALGVGLFRTEFLFLNRTRPPSEEEQFTLYRDIVTRMAPHPVTIRTLDVGGDKFVPEINLADESNPAMGLRGIRFSLKEVRMLKSQLRAVLRAGAHGNVRLMFPLISGLGELRACKAYLAEVAAELRAEGLPFDPDMKTGIMIETPSAALIADLLAREVDFFSVGTNDLIQYCLAVDRGNEHVAYLYEPLHPAVLRALRMICDAGRESGIEVGMCGEMAAEPLYCLVLLGLGFGELSMNASGIPRVKRVLRKGRREEGVRLLDELMRCGTGREASALLEDEMARLFPEIFSAPSI